MDIHFDETRETGGDPIARLVELERILARLQAVQADLLVEAADPAPRVEEIYVLVPHSDEERLIRIADTVREEIACALRRPHAAVQDMIDTARLLAGPLAATHDALFEGVIGMDHVRVIVEAAERLPGWALRDAADVEEFTTACLMLQARVLPVAARASMRNVRRCARRAVLAIDPDGVARRREQAKCTRDVWISGDVDGMSLLCARLATEQAIACRAQIDAAAHARADAPDATAGLTLGQHRVEALTAMVLRSDAASTNGASAVDTAVTAPVRAHVNLTIDLATLLGLQDDAAELTGAGPIPAAVVQELLADPDCAITIRRLVTDPVTGHLLDYGRKTYDIPQGLRDYIVARDRTCRFPGCNRRADLCQLDHAIAWDGGGQTNPQNLGALCTRHHQLKTHGGWEITESRPDGSCTWRSPEGRTYETGPEPPPTSS